jgi:hypothetical protein
MGLVFPRNREEAEAAPRLASVPLIWVQSRGNRDGRPILSLGELKEMGGLHSFGATGKWRPYASPERESITTCRSRAPYLRAAGRHRPRSSGR